MSEPDSWRWGSPGWDCSSFVQGTLWNCGIRVGNYHQAYTDNLFNLMVPAPDPRPGDVIYYRYFDEEQPWCTFPHMGFWAGGGQTLESRYPGGVDFYWPLGTDYVIRRPR